MEKLVARKMTPYTMPTIPTCSANFLHGYINNTLNNPINVGHNIFLEPMLIVIINEDTLIPNPQKILLEN